LGGAGHGRIDHGAANRHVSFPCNARTHAFSSFLQATTVRITENFASNTEKQYLADLEKELNKPDQITDLQKEKKIADTLAKLVLLGDVAETANKCMGIFVRSKLRTINLLSSITDQLYDHFAMSLDAVERKRSMVALKNLIMEIQLDPCVSMTREVKLAYGLVELLIPRITGGLNKTNIEDSMELMGLILRRFGIITRTHREFKNIHLWQEYFCTGVVLGRGAYATVFLGRHVKTAKAVAIKTMDWDNLTRGKPKQEAALTNEIEIMRSSDHPNIVRLYDVIRDGCMVHLVMEYCGGGTLEDYIQNKGPIPEEDCRAFVRQLALGLKFLRDKGIIHRDLKPENLLLSAEQETATLKIADFTFARFIGPGDLATTLVGSPLYMAPEMFLEYKYTEKADLWSVGAIVYKILTKEVHGPHLRFHREYSRFC
jgi:tRNA A-37 threonylcarbamoyl transferase component Bud32